MVGPIEKISKACKFVFAYPLIQKKKSSWSGVRIRFLVFGYGHIEKGSFSQPLVVIFLRLTIYFKIPPGFLSEKLFF